MIGTLQYNDAEALNFIRYRKKKTILFFSCTDPFEKLLETYSAAADANAMPYQLPRYIFMGMFPYLRRSDRPIAAPSTKSKRNNKIDHSRLLRNQLTSIHR